MSGTSLEVADIFRDHGAAWRAANKGHVSLNQMKVMYAIERCRTAALGGHVARCDDCKHEHIAYNSGRNRHCPKCQSSAAKAWLTAREAELLPVRYFHLVFTLPKPIADIAHQNKRGIYNLLMRARADTVIKIAADPKHLDARVGIVSVLHTWGSAMTHHLLPGRACLHAREGPRPQDRSGRWLVAGSGKVGRLPQELLPVCWGPVSTVSPPHFERTDQITQC